MYESLSEERAKDIGRKLPKSKENMQ